MVDEVKKQDSWIKTKWRPAMAWQYLAVCIFDFIVAPSIQWNFSATQWDPLTLKQNGFYHLTMAAIIGVATWSRGQEKMKGAD